MARGLFISLNRKRRGIVSWMIAALILPVLIGLVPQPALSAAQALDRAIADSLCGTQAPASQQDRHQDHIQHCILCSSGTLCCTMALPAGGAAAAPHPDHSGRPLLSEGSTLPSAFALHRDGSPPTGPPSSV
jgi:hypothetical protein